MKFDAIFEMLQMAKATPFLSSAISSTISLLNYSYSLSDMLYKPDATNKMSKRIYKWAHLPGINYISTLYTNVPRPFHRAYS